MTGMRQLVIARPLVAHHRVNAGTAPQQIVAITADHLVPAAAAEHQIVTGLAEQQVPLRTAADNVRSASCFQTPGAVRQD